MRFPRQTLAAALLTMLATTTSWSQLRGTSGTISVGANADGIIARQTATINRHLGPTKTRYAVLKTQTGQSGAPCRFCGHAGDSSCGATTGCGATPACGRCRRGGLLTLLSSFDNAFDNMFSRRDCCPYPASCGSHQVACDACRTSRKNCRRTFSLGKLFPCKKSSCRQSRCGCDSAISTGYDNGMLPPARQMLEEDPEGPPKPPPGASNQPLWRAPRKQYRQAERPSRSILRPSTPPVAPLPKLSDEKPRMFSIPAYQTTRQVPAAGSDPSFDGVALRMADLATRPQPVRQRKVKQLPTQDQIVKQLPKWEPPLQQQPPKFHADAPQPLSIPKEGALLLKPATINSPSDRPANTQSGLWQIQINAPASRIQRTSAQTESTWTSRRAIPDNPLR